MTTHCTGCTAVFDRESLRQEAARLRGYVATLERMVASESASHRATLEELRAVRAELESSRRFGSERRNVVLNLAADRERRARCKACETRRCDRCDWATPSQAAGGKWAAADE